MDNFIVNFFRLTRPLSNVKNIALILVALYFAQTSFILSSIIISFLAVSFVCSSFYVYNSLSDYESDKKNKNKEHYSMGVDYFGKRKTFYFFLIILLLGIIMGAIINIAFFICLILLALTNFLYSSKYTRFKERVFLDIFFGAFLTFLFRFLGFWFVLSYTFPPLLVVAGLVLAKSAGYFTYKSLDSQYSKNIGVKSSVTVLSNKARIIVSILLWFLSFLMIILLCLNSFLDIEILGSLPLEFLFLVFFAIPPVVTIYLSYLKKIKTSVKNLRILGYIYWLIILICALFFL